jgi:hypothetical protein
MWMGARIGSAVAPSLVELNGKTALSECKKISVAIKTFPA